MKDSVASGDENKRMRMSAMGKVFVLLAAVLAAHVFSQQTGPRPCGDFLGGLGEYPEKVPEGAPPRSRVVDSCAEAKAFLLEAKGEFEEAARTPLPVWTELQRSGLAEEWIRKHLGAHRRIFRGITDHASIGSCEVFLGLPERGRTPKPGESPTFAQDLGYAIRWTRIPSGGRISFHPWWSSFDSSAPIDRADPGSERLTVGMDCGPNAGLMYIVSRLNLPLPSGANPVYFGAVRVTTCSTQAARAQVIELASTDPVFVEGAWLVSE